MNCQRVRWRLSLSIRWHRFVLWLMQRELRRDVEGAGVSSSIVIDNDDGLLYRFSVERAL